VRLWVDELVKVVSVRHTQHTQGGMPPS